jgi:hypothetical protein
MGLKQIGKPTNIDIVIKYMNFKINITDNGHQLIHYMPSLLMQVQGTDGTKSHKQKWKLLFRTMHAEYQLRSTGNDECA